MSQRPTSPVRTTRRAQSSTRIFTAIVWTDSAASIAQKDRAPKTRVSSMEGAVGAMMATVLRANVKMDILEIAVR